MPPSVILITRSSNRDFPSLLRDHHIYGNPPTSPKGYANRFTEKSQGQFSAKAKGTGVSRRYTFRDQQELLKFATGNRGRTIRQLAICTFEIYLKFACGLRLMKRAQSGHGRLRIANNAKTSENNPKKSPRKRAGGNAASLRSGLAGWMPRCELGRELY